ncbi:MULTISPECIES: alpha-L-fucosidase [Chryseobacterium]|uniref:alpha-L-fucosidase n=1 Tax=Chryseobacterium camelliae TaxID=1265445 RepID=A0ABU0TFJ9_9FLAO|nr:MULTISPECIES: alpha-L-fucosidase [Chryseobacterium]MDT3406360.1 alpha-L-fucosidase [Pseudacidovorax intermedius]MDQ1095842.1 alpha-L-fucosidase [Chryseobacterium camelliae]MDQ1099778.1 alpha-L-fucosidase [Chryseobacterium sp. SORGH_AS_1048]MDR6087125.1 alpha-L-fucosidase [Chryseobacterium sp. SORGH_AS_0909]MDR6131498.1 alpha-L-fucosidase [Chryseobacterium sp. SORGH_AS_1175]
MKKWIFLSGLMAGILPCAAQNAPQPYGALPTQAQLDWHEMEMYCIIHYGVDTYTDREWGYGDEDPALINPARFDARQIVAAAKAGGFKGVIVVAKHHDGLCLWPTETTAHSIRKSPWKNGKGDMVQEYREACEQLDMKLGIYCSPWDRNSPYYGTPEYVEIYRRQLKELYSSYGKIFISWHDGANGGDGYYGGSRETRKIDRSSYYGWETTWAMIRSMQPGAAIFGDVGPDVRWVGNEEGHAGETCWATYEPQAPEQGRQPSNGFTRYELGTEGTRNGKYWMPAECDVSLRPGWFYHARENSRVKTPDELLDLYYKSVGRGANLDLGLSPNPDGQLNPEDVASLQQFGYLLRKTFSKNLAAGASLSASNTRGNNLSQYGPQHLLDDDRYSYWATDDNETTPELTVSLPAETTFNVIRLRENIKLGQRIEAFTIEAFSGGIWKKIAAATSIGPNRLIRLQNPVTASRIRLIITISPVAIALSDFGLYYEPELLRKPVITRNQNGQISIESSQNGSKIYYTLDGSTPTRSSSRYRKPLRLPDGGLVKAMAFLEDQQSQVAVLQSGPVKTGWKPVQPKPSGKTNPAEYAIDDRPETFYQASSMPSEIVIDMGRKQNVKAVTYLPRQDGDLSGTVTHYSIETSEDGIRWQRAADGEFSNIKANPAEQVMILKKPALVRFIRFKASEILSGKGMTAAEIGIQMK